MASVLLQTSEVFKTSEVWLSMLPGKCPLHHQPAFRPDPQVAEREGAQGESGEREGPPFPLLETALEQADHEAADDSLAGTGQVGDRRVKVVVHSEPALEADHRPRR